VQVHYGEGVGHNSPILKKSSEVCGIGRLDRSDRKLHFVTYVESEMIRN
jgi:hypothetical protein